MASYCRNMFYHAILYFSGRTEKNHGTPQYSWWTSWESNPACRDLPLCKPIHEVVPPLSQTYSWLRVDLSAVTTLYFFFLFNKLLLLSAAWCVVLYEEDTSSCYSAYKFRCCHMSLQFHKPMMCWLSLFLSPKPLLGCECPRLVCRIRSRGGIQICLIHETHPLAVHCPSFRCDSTSFYFLCHQHTFPGTCLLTTPGFLPARNCDKSLKKLSPSSGER